MTQHAAGDGISWDNLESLDVDQPHGLDYRQLNHLAKAVRKRLGKEHVGFDDLTVGGEHVPGEVQVLAFEDGTSDVTSPFSDGSYRGHGIVWDTTGAVWCITCDNTYSGETPKVVKLHPDKMWEGGDITWAGGHEFDASVDISGNTAIDGDFSVDGTGVFNGNINAVGDFSVDGTLAVGGDMSVDGTADFGDDVAVVGELSVTGGLMVDSTVRVTGDISFGGLVDIPVDITGAGAVRVASAWGYADFTTNTVHASYNVNGVDWSADGKACISFSNALASANYAINLTAMCITGSAGFNNFFHCISQSTTGFRVNQIDTAGTDVNEFTEFYFMVLG